MTRRTPNPLVIKHFPPQPLFVIKHLSSIRRDERCLITNRECGGGGARTVPLDGSVATAPTAPDVSGVVMSVLENTKVVGPVRHRRLTVILCWALVIPVVAACWWLTHPDAVYPYGNGVGMPLGPGQSGALDSGILAVRGVDYQESASITLLDVVPRVTENSADADISLVLCHGGGVGAVLGTDLSGYCSSTSPLPGPAAAFSSPGNQVIVLVTPHQEGVVHIEGFDVTYGDGIRTGTRHGGLDITVTSGPTKTPE